MDSSLPPPTRPETVHLDLFSYVYQAGKTENREQMECGPHLLLRLIFTARTGAGWRDSWQQCWIVLTLHNIKSQMTWASSICFIIIGKCALWRIFSIDSSVNPSSLGPTQACLYGEGHVSEISLPEYNFSWPPTREKSACNTYPVNTKMFFPNQTNVWVIKLNTLHHINHKMISICYMASTSLPMRENQSTRGFQPRPQKMLVLDNMVSRLVSGGMSEHSCWAYESPWFLRSPFAVD